jgi:DNA-binding response OmpR family regulator
LILAPEKSLLDNAAILVVEDEPFIALDLAHAIRDSGGVVIGPAASVRRARVLLETQAIAGAILDVNLIDGDISSIVEYLVKRNVPFILQTGVGVPVNLAARFPDLIVRIKPIVAATLVADLSALLVHPRKAAESLVRDG